MNKTVRSFETHEPSLGKGVYIDPEAVVIGRVTLGNDVSVWPKAVIRGDVNFISIGDACNIQDAAILHVTHKGPFTAEGQPLVIGQGVTIGHQAVLHGCRVDDYCLIGMQALILDGVHIEHHVMIAAGSLVPPGKHLESGYLYLGNPARAIRKLTDKEIAHLDYSAAHYVKLKNKYLASRDALL
ncbi:gamma carbonic anhydrase family protein [Legionella fairfieldensis]|uniref:gamma carbonic anhydrase family protein n=1 Tax=Legionella fairfieldensis TaxID=45064 RepID=UPI00048B5482|nr:gamma carbonic anhydrase family protein [Legionella fairfieldensis]